MVKDGIQSPKEYFRWLLTSPSPIRRNQISPCTTTTPELINLWASQRSVRERSERSARCTAGPSASHPHQDVERTGIGQIAPMKPTYLPHVTPMSPIKAKTAPGKRAETSNTAKGSEIKAQIETDNAGVQKADKRLGASPPPEMRIGKGCDPQVLSAAHLRQPNSDCMAPNRCQTTLE